MSRRIPNTSARSAGTVGRTALQALLLSLVVSGSARGQAVAPTSSTPPDTARPVTFLKEVVVTGSRFPRAYYESPQALSFVSRLQLREAAPTVLGDVLAGLPGVDNSKDSPWEQRPVLRGLSGQRVLVLMDGSPINSARGNGPHPSLVDPSQVERIEVVRGPSSVAYGSDALGGVINIITREAPSADTRSLRGSASIGGATVDEQRNGYLELVPRIGRLSAFVSTGGRQAEDFRTPNGKVPNSAFSDYNALANVRWDFTEKTALKAGYQLYRGHDIGIPGLSFDSPGARQDFLFSFYDRDQVHLTLDHGYRASWLAGTRLKVYWQRENRNFFSDQDIASSQYNAFGLPPRAGSSRVATTQDRFFDLDTWGLQTQLTSVRTDRYRFTAGIDAARDQTGGDNVRFRTYYDSTGAVVPGAGGVGTAVRRTQSVPSGNFDNYGVFAQSEWFVAPRWTVSAGGRYTQYRYRTEAGIAAPPAGPPPAEPSLFEALEVDEGAPSGSLGLTWNPMTDLHVTANVANGYRQPNAQDLFFKGAASVGFVLGNADLHPEKSVSYDLGLRWGPGNLGVAGNLFYSTYDDLIDAVSVPPPPEASGQPSYQYTNISEARIWGGEVEAEWRFRPTWSARTALAGAVGDITSEQAIRELFFDPAYTGPVPDEAPLAGVPPFKGSFGLRWSDAGGRFWVEPSTRFSWRTNRLPLPTPGVPFTTDFKSEWIVADLFTGARLPWGQRIVLGARNLADTPYRQPLGSLDEPGFSLVGTLSTDF